MKTLRLRLLRYLLLYTLLAAAGVAGMMLFYVVVSGVAVREIYTLLCLTTIPVAVGGTYLEVRRRNVWALADNLRMPRWLLCGGLAALLLLLALLLTPIIVSS